MPCRPLARCALSSYRHVSTTNPNCSTTSHRWQHRHRTDPFVSLAHEHSYRARSAFKLIQLNDKYKLFKPGTVALDLGSAPGSWCQVMVERTNAIGQHRNEACGIVIGVDLQPISPIPGAHLLSMCDITKSTTTDHIVEYLNGRMIDIVLSDIAPKASGNQSLDHDRIIVLCRSVLQLLTNRSIALREGGSFLCKIWDGDGRSQLVADMRQCFARVDHCKPIASRTESAEVYLLARHFTTK